ncbi:hypothetical protein P5V15_011901 [Pogonomyrmex californicus]
MDSEGTLGRGHANGGRGLRRQRSLEWRERRGYGAGAQSSSDDEDNARHAVGPVSSSSTARGARSPGQVFASIFAQQYNSETVYAASTKKTTSGGGTLGRRTRRGHASALSSSSTASDRSETVFPDEHTRMHLTNGLPRPIYLTDTGRDSPPEPAPPEVPPRGPSLHATHTLRTQQNRNGCPPNASGSFTVPSDQMPTETYSGKLNTCAINVRLHSIHVPLR